MSEGVSEWRTCPPTALPTSAMIRSTRAGGTAPASVSRAMCSKEYDSSASPARMAISSPYTFARERVSERVSE